MSEMHFQIINLPLLLCKKGKQKYDRLDESTEGSQTKCACIINLFNLLLESIHLKYSLEINDIY